MKMMIAAMTRTTLITTMSPIGTLGLAAVGAVAAFGAATGGAATTGAGARLIRRVKSLGPASCAGADPPIGESGVVLP